MKRFGKVLMILVLIQLFNACLFNDDDNNDDFTKHHDSYVTLLEYHAYKQVIMYDFYKLFSDGYTNSTLFEYTPGDEELSVFFEKIETLLSYEEALNEAINVLQNKSTVSMNANDYLLKSAMADWDWLLKYVPFKGKNIELRNKILAKSKSMSNEQKETLFLLVSDVPSWTGDASDANDFFSKMKNGDLDNSILRLHKTFHDYDSEYFSWADNNKLNTTQLAFDYGKEGLETGQKVIVTTIKNINPAVGQSIDILEKGNQFLEYINQCMSEKSFNQFANDANVQITGKYAESGLNDQGEPANQKTLSVVESAQLLTKTALVNSDPVSVVNTDFEWGGIKLNNEDESLVPDIVFAERIMGDIAPNVILCAEMLVDELGQWVVPLPSGKWDIVAVDEKGVSDTITDWSVITQHFGVADISAPKTKVDDDEGNDESDENIDFPQYKRISFDVGTGWYENADGNVYFRGTSNNIHGMSDEVSWDGNQFAFSGTYEYDDGDGNESLTSITLSGAIGLEDESMVCSIIVNYEFKLEGNGYPIYKNFSYTLSNIPYGGTDFVMSGIETVNSEKFEISEEVNSEFLPKSHDYISNLSYYSLQTLQSGSTKYEQIDEIGDIGEIPADVPVEILVRFW